MVSAVDATIDCNKHTLSIDTVHMHKLYILLEDLSYKIEDTHFGPEHK